MSLLMCACWRIRHSGDQSSAALCVCDVHTLWGAVAWWSVTSLSDLVRDSKNSHGMERGANISPDFLRVLSAVGPLQGPTDERTAPIQIKSWPLSLNGSLGNASIKNYVLAL